MITILFVIQASEAVVRVQAQINFGFHPLQVNMKALCFANPRVDGIATWQELARKMACDLIQAMHLMLILQNVYYEELGKQFYRAPKSFPVLIYIPKEKHLSTQTVSPKCIFTYKRQGSSKNYLPIWLMRRHICSQFAREFTF